MSTPPPTPWIRRYRPESGGGTPLVLLPPAGASASFFAALSRDAPDRVDPWAVVLPGREARLGEPPVEDLRELADALAAELGPLLAEPVVLLGHSMGASVAHELARRLEAASPGSVRHLVVAGRGGPSVQRERRPARAPTDAELVDEIAAAGDTPRELLEDPDVLELLLPPLRTDHAMLAAYAPDDEPLLAAGVTALVGEDDPTTTLDGVSAWRDATTGPFAAATAPGGHLFLAARTHEVVAAVAAAIAGEPTTGVRPVVC